MSPRSCRIARACLLWLLLPGVASSQSSSDFDGDGIGDAGDNCPYVANADQLDRSGDGRGDACTCGDLDADGIADLRDSVVLRRDLASLAPGIADRAKCSVTGGSSDCDAADAVRLREVVARIPEAALEPVCRAAVGASELPMRMAVAGDSITRGFAADCTCNFGLSCLFDCLSGGTEQPWHSWFDGDDTNVFSLYDRYLRFDPAITTDPSAAASGARMRGGDDSFAIQSARVLTQNPLPDLVVVLLGGNDICSRDCALPGSCSRPLLTDAEWRAAVQLGLDPLMTGLPDGATVLLGSVPRIQDLFDAGGDKQAGDSSIQCDLVWATFDICRVATDFLPREGESLSTRLDAIAERQRRYNEILAEEALAYRTNANGRNPRGIGVYAEYVDELTPSLGTFVWGAADINGSDCFHPSLAGQNEIAELLWRSSPAR
jgi:lysophospholipase L1-like esterase